MPHHKPTAVVSSISWHALRRDSCTRAVRISNAHLQGTCIFLTRLEAASVQAGPLSEACHLMLQPPPLPRWRLLRLLCRGMRRQPSWSRRGRRPRRRSGASCSSMCRTPAAHPAGSCTVQQWLQGATAANSIHFLSCHLPARNVAKCIVRAMPLLNAVAQGTSGCPCRVRSAARR